MSCAPLPVAPPDQIGLDPARLQRVYALLQRWVDGDRLPAAALCVGRRGRPQLPGGPGELVPLRTE